MTVGTKKTVLATVITVLLTAVIVPAAYWFISAVVDDAFGLQRLVQSPALPILSALAFLIGIFWIYWAYSYLYFVGRGLPTEIFGRALHPTRYLVTTGPYAYTRNPMMFGLLFILLGVALLQGSISGLVMAPMLMGLLLVYLVAFEEPGLRNRFGEDYAEYRSHVPLLLPRFSPYLHEPVATS